MNQINIDINTENGLKHKYQQRLLEILKTNPRIVSVSLFGSRAIGTYKVNSDIDLVLEGPELGLSDIATILAAIEQTSIPFSVDILIKHKIDNVKLLEHINTHGVLWY